MKVTAPCYVEKHHVFPTSIFGKNERVVYLTAREHVLAHLLLFKAALKRYGRHHWKTWKTAGAATAMGLVNSTHLNRTFISCSTLGLAREVEAENKSINYTGKKCPGRQVGRVWWNNGVEQTRSRECPGEKWVRGRLNYSPKPKEERVITEKGREAWRNAGAKVGAAHVESGQWDKVRCVDGRGGAAGRGNVWWNNGKKSTRAKVSPGEGWVRGRLKRNN